MTTITSCLLCKDKVTELGHKDNKFRHLSGGSYCYYCKRCSYVFLTNSAASVVENYSDKDRLAISITLRNEWERMGQNIPEQSKSTDDLKRIIKQFKPMPPLEKMDNALLIFDKQTKYVGEPISIAYDIDYPYFYCSCRDELSSILAMMCKERLLDNSPSAIGNQKYRITATGLKQLRSIC